MQYQLTIESSIGGMDITTYTTRAAAVADAARMLSDAEPGEVITATIIEVEG